MTMEAQLASLAAKKAIPLAKKLAAAGALIALGLMTMVAALVGSITSGNEGNLVTGPQYVVTGSVMPPPALLAVFKTAANADGFASLSPTIQSAVRGLSQATGNAMPCTLPWQLLSAESYVESRYHTGSVSGAGAQGIMQFEPTTFGGYAAMVGALNPSGGSAPPSAFDAPDAIYAADLLLCGDGATSSTWSVGDIRAVGQYNCGGTWITNPGACQYGGFTTTDYVNEVHAVFDKLVSKSALSPTSPQTPLPNSTSPSSGGGGGSPSPTTTPAPNNPLAGSISGAASELIGQQVNSDNKFIYAVCQLASSGSTLPAPTGMSSLTDISTKPAIGDFAGTPYGLGVYIGGSQVVVVDNGTIQAIPTAKGWSYGIDPSYT